MNIEELNVGDVILYKGATVREGEIKRKTTKMIKVSDKALPFLTGGGYFESWIPPEWVIEILKDE